jgi:hypothetical protein
MNRGWLFFIIILILAGLGTAFFTQSRLLKKAYTDHIAVMKTSVDKAKGLQKSLNDKFQDLQQEINKTDN